MTKVKKKRNYSLKDFFKEFDCEISENETSLILLVLSKNLRESISYKEFNENLDILFKNEKDNNDLRKADDYNFTFSENQLKQEKNHGTAHETDNTLRTLKKKPNYIYNLTSQMPTYRHDFSKSERIDTFFEYLKLIIEEGRKIENLRQNIVLNENFNNIDAFDFMINYKKINYITINDFDKFKGLQENINLLFRQYGNSKNKTIMT